MSRIADFTIPVVRSRAACCITAAFLALGGPLAPAEVRAQAIDKATLDRAKDATVYVKIKVKGQTHSVGSGLAIKATGDTLMILTNRHVAVSEADELPAGAKPEIFVVFRSATPQEQELPARLVTFDHRPLLDLAILEVKGVRQPPPPILAERPVPEPDLFETMTTYSLGFPYIGLVGAKDVNYNPAVTVNAMTISSFRRDEANRLERIQFNGSMIQGNSGGPIINDKGALVGVVVSRIGGENVGYAIPPNVITSFLGGSVDITFGRLISWTGSTAKFAVGGRMVDPFGRIRSMSARYLTQSALPAPPKPDAKGFYPILPNSKAVPLEVRPSTSIQNLPIADAAGYGEVDLPVKTPDDRKLYFQIVLTDSFGRTYGGKPTATTLPDKPDGMLHDLDSERSATPATLARWSCEVNVIDGAKMKHEPGLTTISLPGGIPMNNSPQSGLFNAPCALVKVDGDFMTAVEILNTFDPGSEGVVLPNGKKFPTSFQSTGILIWQDEKNFVRLERSKGSDGKISMLNRVLVEVYKNGKEAAIHYIDVPEQPIGLFILRKGGSIRLLYALLNTDQQVNYRLFHEMAVDFNNEVFVGLAAANLSKRPFQAKLKGFHLTTLDKADIVAKPVKMTRLVEPAFERLADGTLVFEGAAMKVMSATEAARVVPQTNMADFKGQWSDGRQLLWNNERAARTLALELPVDAAGKYEIKARFTYAPDYAIAKLDIDGRPLNKDEKIDFYAPEVRPSNLMSLGTYPLSKGKRKLTVTIYNKNPKSSGFHFGLDEIHLIPVK